MTDLDAQTAFITEAQSACRIARDSRKAIDLQKAAAMLDSHRFDELPIDAQIDLSAAYGAAMIAQTGALS